ncbi:hypothetical protein BASA60_004511 [Batrachochytrium salamandrivorans]|nr:hypothetical protein BASA60_004511 [Batrachochytrium salamandrivorans]
MEYDNLIKRKVQRRYLLQQTLLFLCLNEKIRSSIEEGALDTSPAVVSEITWSPNILTCPFPAPFMMSWRECAEGTERHKPSNDI